MCLFSTWYSIWIDEKNEYIIFSCWRECAYRVAYDSFQDKRWHPLSQAICWNNTNQSLHEYAGTNDQPRPNPKHIDGHLFVWTNTMRFVADKILQQYPYRVMQQ